MKVLLVQIDGSKPNLALEKIARYHRDRGDEVFWNEELYAPSAERIYVSSIYDWSRPECKRWKDGLWGDKVICGGTGWDVESKLPAQIKKVRPRINWGFTTRGCIRQCPWCVVPAKEGNKVRVVGDLIDLWDGHSRDITLLDNNILAVPEHFKLVCRQARDNGSKLDFNQGLDCRLLTEDLAAELAAIRHTHYKFAFDEPAMRPAVERAVRILQDHGIKQATWFVLVGFNTTFREDLDRLYFLRKRRQAAYVMRYNYNKSRRYIALAQWANNHAWFAGMTFEQFLKRPERKEHRYLLKEVCA
ncbi:MAG: radical SAM protein [Planctomycetota bacterium]|jgi:hypothetical protein